MSQRIGPAGGLATRSFKHGRLQPVMSLYSLALNSLAEHLLEGACSVEAGALGCLPAEPAEFILTDFCSAPPTLTWMPY